MAFTSDKNIEWNKIPKDVKIIDRGNFYETDRGELINWSGQDAYDAYLAMRRRIREQALALKMIEDDGPKEKKKRGPVYGFKV